MGTITTELEDKEYTKNIKKLISLGMEEYK